MYNEELKLIEDCSLSSKRLYRELQGVILKKTRLQDKQRWFFAKRFPLCYYFYASDLESAIHYLSTNIVHSPFYDHEDPFYKDVATIHDQLNRILNVVITYSEYLAQLREAEARAVHPY